MLCSIDTHKEWISAILGSAIGVDTGAGFDCWICGCWRCTTSAFGVSCLWTWGTGFGCWTGWGATVCCWLGVATTPDANCCSKTSILFNKFYAEGRFL